MDWVESEVGETAGDKKVGDNVAKSKAMYT